MSTRGVERRLRKSSERLRSLREELALADAQLEHLVEDAAEASLRALVAESPEAAPEARRAQEHADAMAAHRVAVAREIAETEAEQDRLLDELSAQRP